MTRFVQNAAIYKLKARPTSDNSPFSHTDGASQGHVCSQQFCLIVFVADVFSKLWGTLPRAVAAAQTVPILKTPVGQLKQAVSSDHFIAGIAKRTLVVIQSCVCCCLTGSICVCPILCHVTAVCDLQCTVAADVDSKAIIAVPRSVTSTDTFPITHTAVNNIKVTIPLEIFAVSKACQAPRFGNFGIANAGLFQ